ncbi:MAG: YqiA/YcfP family alpha/beta fold hydrolase [Kouleothrix sp.]
MSTPAIIFIHGQDSSSRTHKAELLRTVYPDAVVPDFSGPLEQRMAQLRPILGQHDTWAIIGSSMGGLMATLWACAHQTQAYKLILLAPAIHLRAFVVPPQPIDVPTVVYHGLRDTVVPLAPVRAVAERTFSNLRFNLVDDDHRLHATAEAIDWRALIEG